MALKTAWSVLKLSSLLSKENLISNFDFTTISLNSNYNKLLYLCGRKCIFAWPLSERNGIELRLWPPKAPRPSPPLFKLRRLNQMSRASEMRLHKTIAPYRRHPTNIADSVLLVWCAYRLNDVLHYTFQAWIWHVANNKEQKKKNWARKHPTN